MNVLLPPRQALVQGAIVQPQQKHHAERVQPLVLVHLRPQVEAAPCAEIRNLGLFVHAHAPEHAVAVDVVLRLRYQLAQVGAALLGYGEGPAVGRERDEPPAAELLRDGQQAAVPLAVRSRRQLEGVLVHEVEQHARAHPAQQLAASPP